MQLVHGKIVTCKTYVKITMHQRKPKERKYACSTSSVSVICEMHEFEHHAGKIGTTVQIQSHIDDADSIFHGVIKFCVVVMAAQVRDYWFYELDGYFGIIHGEDLTLS